ncbi:armadillo-like helical domain-containing protein 3 isoform X4 [Culex pipiens pallens]|uniref:armadillo-like helical domain-containing protein 3 isoform X4 n=1 Tax=Culex pipiens pallens TaxID=42434 RepID=UPI0022AAC291|nr:armadillo-like helical domain-containing protein 3 isoform X4 [Culex pipiens pallens]
MSTRKRSGSGTKQPKEKIVYIFESLFRGEDVVRGYNNFWNELFLITPPSLEILDTEIQQLDDLKMCAAKPNIILVVKKCIEMLDSDNPKRVNNSLITLSSLTFALCRKYSVTQETSENYLEYVVAEAEDEIKSLIDKIKVLLSESDESSFYCIKFLLPILITNSCGRNKIMEYIMAANNLFEPLKKILSDPTQRLKYGNDIVILLTLLVNYRKSDRTNPYAVQLSLLDDEFALHGFGQIISTTLFEFIRLQSTNDVTTHNNSWISSFSSIVGNIFLSEEIDGKSQNIRQNTVLLLALYEAVHLNRNFITTLATTHTETSTAPSDLLSNSDVLPEVQTAPMLEASQYPTNLIVAVFQYCSVVMADHKNDNSLTNLKLCFIVLTCISEDQYANSMMHNLTFQVFLNKAHMRHRKVTSDRFSKPQPLAATLLDLLTEFIVTHLLKKFPMEHYLLCIGIIQRIIIYQKRCRIRLMYPWKSVWTAIISMLKFIMCQEQQLVKKMNIFNLLTKYPWYPYTVSCIYLARLISAQPISRKKTKFTVDLADEC